MQYIFLEIFITIIYNLNPHKIRRYNYVFFIKQTKTTILAIAFGLFSTSYSFANPRATAQIHEETGNAWRLKSFTNFRNNPAGFPGIIKAGEYQEYGQTSSVKDMYFVNYDYELTTNPKRTCGFTIVEKTILPGGPFDVPDITLHAGSVYGCDFYIGRTYEKTGNFDYQVILNDREDSKSRKK